MDTIFYVRFASGAWLLRQGNYAMGAAPRAEYPTQAVAAAAIVDYRERMIRSGYAPEICTIVSA